MTSPPADSPSPGTPSTGTSSLPPSAGPGVVAALQAALAAEHAAVYGYGVAGAHLAGARLQAATSYWTAHQVARDSLTAMLTALGAQPVPSAASYQLPFPVPDAPAAVRLATYLEERVATAYLGLVALTPVGLRRFGAQSTQTAALRAAWWRGSTLAFPGLGSGG
jgi:hypothetical protein